ncbi:opsin 9 [Hypomesus transpacificus]|uniref:opsin 9 n=1 Tax=Hypomesus transpacificus TaxID=137520 RepID=UPI001F07A418|nr:opsin 9 [Hypomesus transpacificus]
MSAGLNGTWRDSVPVPSSLSPAFQSHLTPSADLGVAILMVITGAVSVLGNGTVLLVYGKKRKTLRPPELMTINLAVCDFGYSLIGAPCIIISSLSHAWVFGESGCLWYGIQGFVFGIGSLITTSLISLDRCLKICSLRYGQWIERRHMSLAIALIWAYTVFWAVLPAFGFGSYGPEPFGTSCTINWWKMRSSLKDRAYIFLILTLCFGVPTLTIIVSYLAILRTVYKSHQTLASIPSSTVTHSSRDMRLTKIAAVVCSTFLLAWTPYAIVSLYSALAHRNEWVEGSLHPSTITDLLGLPTVHNWTSTESYGGGYDSMYYDQAEYSDPSPTEAVTTTRSSPLVRQGASEPDSSQPVSCLPPVVTLIPAMFAKSHCMINPFIYQIMNKEFREDVYDILRGRDSRERRRTRATDGSYSQRSSINLSYCQSWRQKNKPMAVSMVQLETKQQHGEKGKGGGSGSWSDNTSVGWDALDVASLDTQVKMEGRKMSEKEEMGGSTSSSLLTE